VGKLIFLCYLVYVVTYFGRMNYSSCIVAITSELGCANSEAGLVSSYFFAAYAVGQIVNGLLADRVNNKLMVAGSLFCSAAINLLMPFMPGITAMKYLWLLNGVVQSVMWTNLVGIVSVMVPIDLIPRSMVVLITSSNLGTLTVYGYSSLCLSISTWRTLFYTAFVLLALAGAVWSVFVTRLERHMVWSDPGDTEPAPQTSVAASMKQLRYIFAAGGLGFAVMLSLLNGAHREGIMSWIPSFAKDTYGISESFSVLVAILLPVVNFFGSPLNRLVSKRLGKLGNGVFSATFFYVISLALMILLRCFAWSGLAGACLLFASLTLLMTAINAAIVGVIPVEMAAYGCSASLTGFLNFGYCLGSALSTYGLGYISDRLGWASVLDALWIAGVAAVLIGGAGSFFWTRFLKRLSAGPYKQAASQS